MLFVNLPYDGHASVKIKAGGLFCKESACIIEVCFAGIVEKLRVADVAVFANPVYNGDVSVSR